MNFQQLRIIRETVRRNFNLTEVAGALHTSQSGVSKHIKDLEDELGVELFIRKGKRLLGLNEPGQELVGIEVAASPGDVIGNRLAAHCEPQPVVDAKESPAFRAAPLLDHLPPS